MRKGKGLMYRVAVDPTPTGDLHMDNQNGIIAIMS